MKELIVIEGLDGSGKATQAELLCKALRGESCNAGKSEAVSETAAVCGEAPAAGMYAGQPVRKVSFPDYASDSSALVKMYLAGQFGTRPDDVNAYAASSFYAVDRFASFRKDWMHDWEHGVIIADRYTTSNAIHQCSKLDSAEWDAFLEWLFDYEYRKLGIPEPGLVIYLKVDPDVSQKLLTERYVGDESKKDIHEKDLAYLKRSREAAEYCSRKLGWQVVQCDRDGAMRSIGDIHQEIMEILRRYQQ